MDKIVKVSTGLVGLAVEPKAREILTRLYKQILRDLRIMPDHLEYRKVMEGMATRRLKILEESVRKNTRMMVTFRSISFDDDWPSVNQFRCMDVTTISVVEHPYGRNGSMPLHQFGDRRFIHRYCNTLALL